MGFVLCILYVLAGVLLAVPYCLLAGWHPDSFILTAVVAPVFLFIWVLLAGFAGILDMGYGESRAYFNWRAAFRNGDRRKMRGSRLIFWIWTLYSLLPIILRWSAVLLEKVGYESVGAVLYTHRYSSLIYIFAATMMLFLMIGMVGSAWEAMKDGWTRLTHH